VSDNIAARVTVTPTILKDHMYGVMGLELTIHDIPRFQASMTIHVFSPPTQAEIEAFNRLIRVWIDDPVDQDRLMADFLVALRPYMNYSPQPPHAVN
jgi:hypothetical protein